jgi:hypothetical protein
MIDEFLKEVDRCFDIRWRGYDRRQVDARFADVDQELAAVYRDRDTWLMAAADLTRLLEESRSELTEFRSLHAGCPQVEVEQESQRRLAEATLRAREIVGAALAESRNLIEDLAERQRELDEWYADVAASVDVPVPRRPMSETTGRHQLVRSPGERGRAALSPAEGAGSA